MSLKLVFYITENIEAALNGSSKYDTSYACLYEESVVQATVLESYLHIPLLVTSCLNWPSVGCREWSVVRYGIGSSHK